MARMYHAGASSRSSYLPSEKQGNCIAFGASEAVGDGAGWKLRATPGNHPIQRDAFENEICSRRDWKNRAVDRYYVAERSYCDKSCEERNSED